MDWMADNYSLFIDGTSVVTVITKYSPKKKEKTHVINLVGLSFCQRFFMNAIVVVADGC